MNRVLTALLLTVTGFGVTPVLASTIANAFTVPVEVAVQASDIAYIYFPLTSRTGTPPSCAANIGGVNVRYAVDLSTTAGRSQLAVLLASVASGYGVFYQGSGTCTVDASTENLMGTGISGSGGQ